MEPVSEEDIGRLESQDHKLIVRALVEMRELLKDIKKILKKEI